MVPEHRGPLPFIPLPILMNNIFLMIAFYVNLLVLMPNLFNKRKWGWYIFFSCLFLMGSFFIHDLAIQIEQLVGMNIRPMGYHHGGPPEGFEFKPFSFIYTFMLIWAVSMVYVLIVQLQESKQHAEMVRANALQSELSFLKAQINPHFLFNTLNNIYMLTLKKSEDAPLAVMKLSNLMRQLTDDTGVDFVPFTEEEKFIRGYIELQQMRLTDKTKVRYETSGNFETLRIAPRLLIPFIDNAFKYGVSNRNESEIAIRFQFSGSMLTFTIQNAIHPVASDSLEQSTGIGLENVNRRLDLLYKGNYSLKKTQTKDSYLIQLIIDLSR